MSAPEFGATSTTDEVLADVDLSGEVAAVTGASGGLGLETARALAARGAHVVLAARNPDKLADAVDTITAQHPGASLDTIVLDLADIGSCRRAAVELLTRVDRLDLLVNNAGVMCTPFGHTADGFEMQTGTNHLGHMAWTIPLIDLLTRSSPARIINLSSAGHRFGDVDLDDLNWESREYDEWAAYGQSKTANVLFSVELERRFGPMGVHAVAVHPGGIHTDLGRHMTPDLLAEIGAKIEQSNPGGFDWKTIPQGAATTVWAATTPEFAERGGVYCEDCHVAAIDDGGGSEGVLGYALDPERAAALWDRSMQLLATV
ncbi:SDR family NAD(P)-dependent oxidoreductase [Ilumatobacter coccineus]|uniref:Probable oxidoreductase n=1 Tax=Ilumatobacter coccineus (strain NBRC 103263 / KCTC 29153 / YM16-304) TaxID=1313172 RepID=A0A6C7E742_ILUCY|nr:SDR family NAD(P)-dependent oxidoreductase [Ilumatobacter coccineus]BAN00428.1 putative oxidoreductase [Ilumatobacter coccineus YM16-304]